MIAARNGDLGMLQALLSRGADSSVRDSQGRTVFEWAEPSSTTAKYVVAFLLDRGISKEVPRPTAPVQSPQVKASLADARHRPGAHSSGVRSGENGPATSERRAVAAPGVVREVARRVA